MIKIYSKVKPQQILHIIVRKNDIRSERMNIIDDEHFLQLAAMLLPNGKTFKPHKHVYSEKTTTIAQESWVVIQGRVKAILYDLDDTIIEKPILESGDVSITLHGGHTYEILEDNTLVYEYKTGPYTGVENDKEFIK